MRYFPSEALAFDAVAFVAFRVTAFLRGAFLIGPFLPAFLDDGFLAAFLVGFRVAICLRTSVK